MKKTLSILAALFAVALLWCAVTVFAAELPFSDVKEKSWYYSYVKESYEKGYMEGKPGGIFAPNESVTRAQYVTILARLCDAEEDTDTGFTDVGAKKWYAGAVGWAVKAGIVTGYEDNTFRGDNSISRQELMVMTSRYLDYIWTDLPDSDNAVESFADASKIAKWAVDYVDEMRAVGLVEGDAQGNFNPKKTATRAEIATMTVRLGNALDSYDADATIGGNALAGYSIYSDSISADALAPVVEAVKEATGVTLPVSDTKTEKSIVFTVDTSLKMLQYGISEENGILTVAVHHKYALPYLPETFADAASLRENFNIPAGYKGTGVYAIDAATEVSGVSLVCETDKNPLSYKLGESVTFSVSLVSDGRFVSVPQFSYTFSPEYGREITDLAPGISGQFVKTFDGLDQPGSAYLYVFAANRKGQKIVSLDRWINASVVYDFYNIRSIEKPADFDSFWDAKVAELMAVEPTAISSVECEHCKCDGFKVYDVAIQSLNTVAYAHVSYPENAAPGSLTITGVYDGYGSVDSDSAQYNAGAITVAVNRNEVPNHLDPSYYVEYEKTIEGWGFDNPTAEESYFMGAVMRDIQALRYATVAFADLWDGKTMSTSGGSMGGFQAVAVAGLYDKVTHCYPGIPWMCDVGGYTVGRLHGSFFPDYSEGSKYFDSTYFAERFKGVAHIDAGLGDGCCRTSGTVALYNAFAGLKSGIYRQGVEHGAAPEGVIADSFGVSYDVPVVDEMKKDIADNGLAVTPPDYSANRKLNASEQKMKEATDQYTKKVRWIETEFTLSATVTSEAVSKLIQDALVDKCGLDGTKYTVVVDEDSITALRSEYGAYANGSYFFQVEYMVTDADGGFVDATARMLITKNVPPQS